MGQDQREMNTGIGNERRGGRGGGGGMEEGEGGAQPDRA